MTMDLKSARGIPMGIRTGNVDPVLILLCASKEQMTPAQFKAWLDMLLKLNS